MLNAGLRLVKPETFPNRRQNFITFRAKQGQASGKSRFTIPPVTSEFVTHRKMLRTGLQCFVLVFIGPLLLGLAPSSSQVLQEAVMKVGRTGTEGVYWADNVERWILEGETTKRLKQQSVSEFVNHYDLCVTYCLSLFILSFFRLPACLSVCGLFVH